MADHGLTRINTVRDRLTRNELLALFSSFVKQGQGMLQPDQLLAEYEAVIPKAEREKLKDGIFEDLLKAAQEAIVIPPWVALTIRPQLGVWEYVSGLAVEELTVPKYLHFKEELVDGT